MFQDGIVFPLLWNLASHDLGACYKNRNSGPIPDGQNQNLHFKKIPRWITWAIRSKKHCSKRLHVLACALIFLKNSLSFTQGKLPLSKVNFPLKISVYKRKQLQFSFYILQLPDASDLGVRKGHFESLVFRGLSSYQEH